MGSLMKYYNLPWLLIITVFFSTTANAICHRSYVCDDHGQCQYQDVCDSTLDLPSVEIDPLPSLPTTKLKPLPSIEIPPLGTTKCEYMLVNGEWQNICQ